MTLCKGRPTYNKEDASHDNFLRALQIRKKQSKVNLIKDEEGHTLNNLDSMAKAMLNHLSQINGKKEVVIEEVLAS